MTYPLAKGDTGDCMIFEESHKKFLKTFPCVRSSFGFYAKIFLPYSVEANACVRPETPVYFQDEYSRRNFFFQAGFQKAQNDVLLVIQPVF